MHAQTLQSCPTLCNPVGWCPPNPSVPGILQARILEWTPISFSKGSARPRDWTHVSCSGRQILHHWATGKPWCVCVCVHICVCIHMCVCAGRQPAQTTWILWSKGTTGPQIHMLLSQYRQQCGVEGPMLGSGQQFDVLGRHTWIQSPLPSADSKLLLGGFITLNPTCPCLKQP